MQLFFIKIPVCPELVLTLKSCVVLELAGMILADEVFQLRKVGEVEFLEEAVGFALEAFVGPEFDFVAADGGVVAGFQSSVLMLPQQQLSITFLTNQQARQNVARRMGEQIAAMAMGKPFPEHKPITLTDAALTQFEGVYQREGKPARTITRAGAQLRQTAGTSQSVMQPFAEREFFQPDGSFTRYRFETDVAGKVVRMVRIDIGDEEEIYTRISDAPARAANATRQ